MSESVLMERIGELERERGEMNAALRAEIETNALLREALLAQRDTDEEDETETRTGGPCWCPGWVATRKHGHGQSCLQARVALGIK